MIGGMKAVIWTDLVQFIISMSGFVWCIIGVLDGRVQLGHGRRLDQSEEMIAPDTGTPAHTLGGLELRSQDARLPFGRCSSFISFIAWVPTGPTSLWRSDISP